MVIVFKFLSVNPIKLSHTNAQFLFGWYIEVPSYELLYDPKTLRGLPSKIIEIQPVVPKCGNDIDGSFSEIIVPDFFPPGSIMVFETYMTGLNKEFDQFIRTGIVDCVKDLSLVELNIMLYRADSEERDSTNNKSGAYHVADLGSIKYCGLEGWVYHLHHIMKYNDLGHPLARHLRSGTWALNYIHSRLFM